MTDNTQEPVAALKPTSVVGIVVCFVLAAVGLFVLPTLQRFGMGFTAAFWTISAVELATAFGIIYFVLNLHEEE